MRRRTFQVAAGVCLLIFAATVTARARSYTVRCGAVAAEPGAAVT